MTPLDTAFAVMEAAPQDDAARLGYYARLADAELCLLLEAEPQGDILSPQVFDLQDGPFVLLFDGEERLAEFVGAPAPYAALPGRVAAGLLAGQGIGIAVNPGGRSPMMIAADAVDWLVATLAPGPQVTLALPDQIFPPGGLPDRLLAALDAKLAQAAGLAEAALLAGVGYADGRRGHLLAFVGAAPEAEMALARAAGEALTFSGVEAGEMDVVFVPAGAPLTQALARQGLRFDLAPAAPPAPAAPKAPGSDPDRPPVLR